MKWKYVLLVLLVVIYIFAGQILESEQLIIKPAYWTLYGVTWGAIIMAILGA